MNQKFNSKLFQRRFDVAIEGLQIVFTDLLIFTESLDDRLIEVEGELREVKINSKKQDEKIKYLEEVINKFTENK